MQIDKNQITWLLFGVFIGVIIIAVVLAMAGRTRPAPIYISPAAPRPTPSPPATPGPMRVHISGEVVEPDVYELPLGSILQDAINAAGGFSSEANGDLLNLALPLSDGMRVHVPAITGDNVLPTLSSGVIPNSDVPAATLNINTATSVELERLPGIGPTLAQRIVDYRQDNGPFVTIEEVQNVSGIGSGKYEQIKDLIAIQ